MIFFRNKYIIILQFHPKPLPPTYSTYLIIFPSWMPLPILQLDYTDHLLFVDLDLHILFCEGGKIIFYKNKFLKIYFVICEIIFLPCFSSPEIHISATLAIIKYGGSFKPQSSVFSSSISS